MSVIDLAQARSQRAEAQAEALAYLQGVATFLVTESIAAAERAFRVASPLRDSDPEIARAIYRFVLRRLRASVRKRIAAEVVAPVLERVEQIYTGRVLVLIDERGAA